MNNEPEREVQVWMQPSELRRLRDYREFMRSAGIEFETDRAAGLCTNCTASRVGVALGRLLAGLNIGTAIALLQQRDLNRCYPCEQGEQLDA